MSLLQAKFNGPLPTRQRSCAQKHRYRNLFDALTEATIIRRLYGYSLWPYRCFYCPYYHLANVPKQVRTLIEGLVGE